MASNFILVITTDRANIKPPLSVSACNYLANFITEKILNTKHLILKSQWSVMVGMIFSLESNPSSDRIRLDPKVRTVSALHAKLHEMVIPLKNADHLYQPDESMLELIWEGLTLFFTSTYKKVTREFMDGLKKQLNMQYILSLSTRHADSEL